MAGFLRVGAVSSFRCPLAPHPLPAEPSAGTKQKMELTCLGSAHAKNDREHGTDALVGYGKKKEKENKNLKVGNRRLRLLNNFPTELVGGAARPQTV